MVNRCLQICIVGQPHRTPSQGNQWVSISAPIKSRVMQLTIRVQFYKMNQIVLLGFLMSGMELLNEVKTSMYPVLKKKPPEGLFYNNHCGSTVRSWPIALQNIPLRLETSILMSLTISMEQLERIMKNVKSNFKV